MSSETTPDRALTGRIELVNRLDAELKMRMFELMHSFYQVEKSAFFDDLQRKTTAVLLEDSAKVLRGFTSVALSDLELDGKKLQIMFSGDTIIHPDFWGSFELPRVWGKFMFEVLQNAGSTPLYWFLLSSGFRTYRYLPAYFNEFFPRFDRQTPAAMQKILDAAACRLYGDAYDAGSGIVRLKNPTPLLPGVSDPSEERLKNPHIAFFLRKNPGYDAGDELACITRLHHENFKPFVHRLLKE